MHDPVLFDPVRLGWSRVRPASASASVTPHVYGHAWLDFDIGLATPRRGSARLCLSRFTGGEAITGDVAPDVSCQAVDILGDVLGRYG